MDRQHGDGIRVRIEVRRGRIVAGLDQRLEMTRHERGAVIGEQRRLGADDVEEAGDVAKLLLAATDASTARRAERAAPTQERVQDLPGRPLVGQRRVLAQVGDEVAWPRPGSPARGGSGPAAGRVPRARTRATGCAGGRC